MPYRALPDIKENFYHVYNRGNNYQDIFLEERNYIFFLKKLLSLFGNNISLVSYSLMPNHYHLLIKMNEDNLLGKVMQRFSTSYTKAINKAYNRVGHLFQGRYKAKLIPDNNSLLHLSRYIHLNPVRAKLVAKPEEWEYSSYKDFILGKSDFNLEMDIILDQIKDYKEFVNSFQEDQNYYVKKLLFH